MTKNLIGHRFGKLRVIFREPNKKGKVMWHCICDCGKEIIVAAFRLKRKESCGCHRIKSVSSDRLFSEHLLYKIYIRECAKNRGYSFELNFEEFYNLIKQNCFYCGSPPSKHYKFKRAPKDSYNGIDRIDSNKNYQKSNVVPCCCSCNSAKMKLTQEEFFNRIKNCYEHLIDKGLISCQ
jgi:hypothetical protein